MKNKLEILLNKFEEASAKRIKQWQKDVELKKKKEKEDEQFIKDFELLKKNVARPVIKKLFEAVKKRGFTLRTDTGNHYEQYVFTYPKEEDTAMVFLIRQADDENKVVFGTQYRSYITEAVDYDSDPMPVSKINEALFEEHFLLMLEELGNF